ncbi:ABC transporter substrate-binding protein [Kitasatospora sp. NPDC059408]|uniref:ABC transporter substrate-binding protein n=1 Tax=Kitasatospora sp. NPDC059408 TaxID=3346823 RepID=UPI00368EF308
MTPPAVRRARPLALVALLSLVAACGTSASADSAAGGGSGQLTLHVGDQGKYLQTLLDTSGQSQGLGYRVVFDQFNSGPLVNQAFAAGAIDLGVMGDTPAIYAAAAGVPVDVVGVSHTVGPGYTLVARAGTGIRTLADLKGHKVAYSKGTANQGFLLQALDTVGLKQHDVTAVDVPLQNIGGVLESGTVDAATASPQDLITYGRAHADAVTLINGQQVSSGYTFWLAAQKSLGDPARRKALVDLVGRIITANSWNRTHPDAWIDAYYVKVNKQTPEVGKLVWQASGETEFAPLSDQVVAAQQRQADLFLANGQVPKKVDVSGGFPADVRRDFNPAVAAGQH